MNTEKIQLKAVKENEEWSVFLNGSILCHVANTDWDIFKKIDSDEEKKYLLLPSEHKEILENLNNGLSLEWNAQRFGLSLNEVEKSSLTLVQNIHNIK